MMKILLFKRYLPISVVGLLLMVVLKVEAQTRFGQEGSGKSEQGQPSRLRASTSLRFNPNSTGSLRYNATELGQRYGVQQVGEATAQVSRQAIPKASMNGPAALIVRADRLVERNQPKLAIELYRQVLAQQPKQLNAQIGLAYALIQIGEFDAALQQYQDVLRQSPNNSEVRLNLGVALYRSGYLEEAIEHYQHALSEHKGPFPTAHFNLAMAYAHAKDFTRAIEHYKLAIQQRGNKYPEACNNLGLVYEAIGQLNEATTLFRKAIEQQRGRYPLAHYNLARFYHSQTEYDQAINEFKLAIKQQADFAEAYLNLGNAYLLRGSLAGNNEIEPAIAAYRKALELRDNFYPLAHENLAIALTQKGDRSAALTHYRNAFEQYEGRCPRTLENLIMTLTDKTLLFVGDELSRDDNTGNLRSKLDELKLTEYLTNALNQYEELEEERKDLPEVRYCAGLVFAAVRDWGKATDEFVRAAQLYGGKDPAPTRALTTILELTRYFSPPF
ncbi:MAG: tetratricopeptide repeat protein [Acidobacteriota bacterium]